MKKGIIIALTLITSLSTISTFANKERVNYVELKAEWIVNKMTFEEMLKASEKKQKLVLLDLYTDWCGWCHKMDATTFNHPIIAAYLNEHFYFVKFNAEQKEPITFKGKEYVWEPGGRSGIHQIGNYAAQGKLNSFPTISILDEKLNSVHVQAGYLTPQQIEPLLHWFVEKPYLKGITGDEFMKNFVSQIQ